MLTALSKRLSSTFSCETKKKKDKKEMVVKDINLEKFKTKTKVITLTNHKGRRQTSEPIKPRSKYLQVADVKAREKSASDFFFLRQLQKFSRAHWLIFIVNKRTDT